MCFVGVVWRCVAKERGDERVEYIPGISSIRIADLPSMLSGNYNQALQLIHQVFSCSQPQYLIFTSIYRLESHVIDVLRNSNLPFPIHTIGPAIPHFKLQNDSVSTPHEPNYLQWLDAQPTRSVLYVSMGSLIPLSSAQAEELVAGLRDASIRYLWVARAETFQERGGGGQEERLGLVVPWCDQLKVLCHPSVGGFWTHCGWNSTVEGAFAGVPMLTFPMIADQVTNSKLVVEDWKIGWRVRGERFGGGDLVVRRDEIARLVGRFMNLEEEEMIEMRERAREVRQICQGAIAEGGSSDIHLRAVVEKISNP